MANERITLEMSMTDMLIAMSDGNPGAMSIVAMLYREGGAIDPDSALGGLGPILFLDTLGIYGSRIWMLCKDICRNDLRIMIAVLRGCQLGFLKTV